MYNFEELGKTIRNHRERCNMSLEELAERCELSDRCISNIERGLTDPRLSTLTKIYSALNVDLSELTELQYESGDEIQISTNRSEV